MNKQASLWVSILFLIFNLMLFAFFIYNSEPYKSKIICNKEKDICVISQTTLTDSEFVAFKFSISDMLNKQKCKDSVRIVRRNTINPKDKRYIINNQLICNYQFLSLCKRDIKTINKRIQQLPESGDAVVFTKWL
ncbi:MAG: hypothetical protein IJY61_03525 [Candidatus Gastranaerophilales bacterium]|nr:hypothetical protein [Candidatus Gastranaerophilales bacterium]